MKHEARLDRFVELLLAWQSQDQPGRALDHPASLWTRHVADSLQLLALAPHAKVWVDLGSGGGFPGMPLACVLAEKPGAIVHLVESNRRKPLSCAKPAVSPARRRTVHAVRIEDFAASI